MNKFSKFFNEDMSEYEATYVYFSLVDGLNEEDRIELGKAFDPISKKARHRELTMAIENQIMMGC